MGRNAVLAAPFVEQTIPINGCIVLIREDVLCYLSQVEHLHLLKYSSFFTGKVVIFRSLKVVALRCIWKIYVINFTA